MHSRSHEPNKPRVLNMVPNIPNRKSTLQHSVPNTASCYPAPFLQKVRWVRLLRFPSFTTSVTACCSWSIPQQIHATSSQCDTWPPLESLQCVLVWFEQTVTVPVPGWKLALCSMSSC